MLQSDRESIHAESCFAARPDVLIWGDSHAASLAAGLRPVLEEAGFALTQLTQAACPPLFDLEVLTSRRTCNETNAQVLAEVRAHQYGVIVLDAAWVHTHFPLTTAQILEKTEDAIATIRAAAPAARLILVGATPRWPKGAQVTPLQRTSPAGAFAAGAYRFDALNAGLAEVAARAGIDFVDPQPVLCPTYDTDGTCLLGIAEPDSDRFLAAYFDSAHLSRAGARLVSEAFLARIEQAPAQR